MLLRDCFYLEQVCYVSVCLFLQTHGRCQKVARWGVWPSLNQVLKEEAARRVMGAPQQPCLCDWRLQTAEAGAATAMKAKHAGMEAQKQGTVS
jgi:hypothetical protein